MDLSHKCCCTRCRVLCICRVVQALRLLLSRVCKLMIPVDTEAGVHAERGVQPIEAIMQPASCSQAPSGLWSAHEQEAQVTRGLESTVGCCCKVSHSNRPDLLTGLICLHPNTMRPGLRSTTDRMQQNGTAGAAAHLIGKRAFCWPVRMSNATYWCGCAAELPQEASTGPHVV